MESEEIKLGAVWHLFSDLNKLIVLTLAELEVAERRIMLGRPWCALPEPVKGRITQVLMNAVSDRGGLHRSL
jgi:hypothetical protein